MIDDQDKPKKQRHTVQRIFERLRDERDLEGDYTTVRDYVRPRRQHLKETFVPLAHPPGHAQADFGEAIAVLGGVEQKVRFFVMSLPAADAVFVKAYRVPRRCAPIWLKIRASKWPDIPAPLTAKTSASYPAG